MKRKLLSLLGFPIDHLEFELNYAIEEIDQLQQWANETKERLIRLQQKLEDL